MEKTFDTKYGEVIVRNAMFDIDGTNLEDGIEIKSDDFELIEIFGHRYVEELTIKEVEEMISAKL